MGGCLRPGTTRRCAALPANCPGRDRRHPTRPPPSPATPCSGTRTLARALGVQRLTVVAAFEELVAEGWIVNERARGAFVSRDLPSIRKPRRFASKDARSRWPNAPALSPARARRRTNLYRVPPGSLLFAPSRPDVRLAPGALLGRAVRRALGQKAGASRPTGRPRAIPGPRRHCGHAGFDAYGSRPGQRLRDARQPDGARPARTLAAAARRCRRRRAEGVSIRVGGISRRRPRRGPGRCRWPAGRQARPPSGRGSSGSRRLRDAAPSIPNDGDNVSRAAAEAARSRAGSSNRHHRRRLRPRVPL